MKYLFYSAFYCSVFFFSCTKKDQANHAAEITYYNLVKGQNQVGISSSDQLVRVQLADSVTNANQLAAVFDLSSGATASVNGNPQTSGITKNDFGQAVFYSVTAADLSTTKSWKVEATNNSSSLEDGLGHFRTHAISVDRSYEWYIDQGTSGAYAGFNCGPASVTMAIKWSDASFSHTAADARFAIEIGGGWWSTLDIDSYLTSYSVPHVIVPLPAPADSTAAVLTHELDNHQILLLCIDMNQMRASTDSAFHVDKFYSTTPNWGHFFVVKGYQVVDGHVYFDIYDPYSFGRTYDDNSLKGKDRFYRSEDIFAAKSVWWNFAFVIAAKGNTVAASASKMAVDPTKIEHAHGY